MLPAFFSTKARTWESAQMMIKKITENLGCLMPSRQNNFKAYKINTISFCCAVGIIHYQYGFVTKHQQRDRSVPAFLFPFCRRERSSNPTWQVLPHPHLQTQLEQRGVQQRPHKPAPISCFLWFPSYCSGSAGCSQGEAALKTMTKNISPNRGQ